MGLKIEKVSKYYGEKLAVDNISFEMNEPGVFGLLGTNGAGKTTTIRMILGIIKKDAGEITWNGQKVERKNVNFGYLPEERGIYPKTKIIEQLMYFAELKGMKKQEAAKEIDYWLKRLKVEEYRRAAGNGGLRPDALRRGRGFPQGPPGRLCAGGVVGRGAQGAARAAQGVRRRDPFVHDDRVGTDDEFLQQEVNKRLKKSR